MTYEELKKMPFRFVCHLSMEEEHATTYISEDGRIGFCDHVRYKDGQPTKRVRRHWQIDGKVYKTTPKFIEALKEFRTNIVPIRKGNFK